jgi:hypothetical protein
MDKLARVLALIASSGSAGSKALSCETPASAAISAARSALSSASGLSAGAADEACAAANLALCAAIIPAAILPARPRPFQTGATRSPPLMPGLAPASSDSL